MVARMREPQGCGVCAAAFTLLSRPRICRQCKRNCCANCVDTNYFSPRGVSPAKGKKHSGQADSTGLCVDCVVAEATSHSISVQEDLDRTEEINRGLKHELKRQLVAMEKFRGFLVEFCDAFAPESALFQEGDKAENNGEQESDSDKKLDPTQPIANLVARGQDSLQNLYARVRRLRSELDAANSDGNGLKLALAETKAQLEAVASERDSLQASLYQINESLLRLEAERQQVADLRRDYEALRARCSKMEQAHNERTSRRDTNLLLQRGSAREEQAENWRWFAVCCPRFAF
ncbi:FYVE zinc finger domain-containing protein, putative [Babesia ovata]|uniref:FYVE zinc finger domain-containing protein, putative n=1 Tax=Babesia ovata TaxID=189622 RepID=A0A2H6KDG2_9APIC|nr:FYVE zinc finger domain-containing protein, putative [Babesia ovata]GBE61038.1 FYVE zinc finger domain-containing protein, putative [Babesia ovata]